MTPAINTYDVDTRVRLDAAFTDEDGGASAPTTVVCTVEAPDGTTSTPAVTNDGAGAYHAHVIATDSGTWRYAFEGTGTIIARHERRFYVRTQQVP